MIDNIPETFDTANEYFLQSSTLPASSSLSSSSSSSTSIISALSLTPSINNTHLISGNVAIRLYRSVHYFEPRIEPKSIPSGPTCRICRTSIYPLIPCPCQCKGSMVVY